MTIVKVYVLRHGETDANANRIIQGQLNTSLNAAGREQAIIVGNVLKNVPFTHAYTSDLTRAVDTARAILVHHPNVPLIATKDLRERYMGNLEGVQVLDRKKRPPNDSTVETSQSLLARLFTWWSQNLFSLLVSPDAPSICHVLVVSHGASISTLMNALYSIGFRAPPPERNFRQFGGLLNTSVTELAMGPAPSPRGPEDAEWLGIVIRYNDASHLFRRTVTQENVDVQENP